MAQELRFKGISVDLTNEIGHGTFGTVYLGTDIESGVNVAAKRLNKKCSDKDPPVDLQAELIPLKRALNHENILQVFDYPFEDGYFWILMEYCDTDLEKYTLKHCSQINYTFKFSIMKQSASGLAFLHQNNIVHRDLKPRNILLQTQTKAIPQVKIADFGTAKLIMEDTTSEMHTCAGTREFMAPELFQSNSEGKLVYKRAVDIYSLGLVFLVLEQAISGRPLNPVMEDPAISPKEANAACIGLAMALRKESVGEYIQPAAILETDSLLKQHVKHLINQMTNTEPSHRPSLETVENKLQFLLDVSKFYF